MIDIQPYIDKLELLKEWLFASIDSNFNTFWVDITAIPQRLDISDVLFVWQQTGMMYFKHEDYPSVVRQLSFDEWYELKIKQ